MKILVLPGWYPGKMNELTGDFVMYQTQALVKVGIHASVIYSDLSYKFLFSKYPLRHTRTFAVENGVPTYRLEGFFPPKVSLFLLKKWAKKYEMLYAAYVAKNGKPSIIHAHTFLGGFAAMHLSQKFDVPYIVTEHNVNIIDGQLKKRHLPIIKKVYNNAQLIIAVSAGLGKKIQENFSTNTIRVIPNSVNTDLFGLKKRRKQDVIQFIAIGDLVQRKGFDILIETFHEIKREGIKNIQLTIVGDGVEKENLYRLRKQLSLNEEVTFAGQASQQKVAELLQKSDIFVLSSHLETFGIVVIEAMSCGLPVIVTRCYGPEDIVTPSSGILIPTNDKIALKKAIYQMIQTYTTYDNEAIRTNVLEQFSNETVTKRLVALYKNILIT